MAHSLAIMTDAAHLLSDLAGFLISIFALWVSSKEPTSRLSFGFHRAEILGALISVLLIWLLTGVLVYEAVDRIQNPTDVNGKLMFIVASCGLGVNILMGFILFQADVAHSHGGLGGGHGHSHGGDEEDHGHAHSDDDRALLGNHPKSQKNINVTAAFVHVLGDGIQSIGVMIAAGLIWHNPDWKICDPICTFLFSILVLVTTIRLVKQSAVVLMEGSPEGIDPDEVQKSLEEIKGVTEVHDLHIWSLSVGKPSLSVHMLCTDDAHAVLQLANDMLSDQYNIHHTTIQVEKEHDQIHCNPKEQERRATSPPRSPLPPTDQEDVEVGLIVDPSGNSNTRPTKPKSQGLSRPLIPEQESDEKSSVSYTEVPVVPIDNSLNATNSQSSVSKPDKKKKEKWSWAFAWEWEQSRPFSWGWGWWSWACTLRLLLCSRMLCFYYFQHQLLS